MIIFIPSQGPGHAWRGSRHSLAVHNGVLHNGRGVCETLVHSRLDLPLAVHSQSHEPAKQILAKIFLFSMKNMRMEYHEPHCKCLICMLVGHCASNAPHPVHKWTKRLIVQCSWARNRGAFACCKASCIASFATVGIGDKTIFHESGGPYPRCWLPVSSTINCLIWSLLVHWIRSLDWTCIRYANGTDVNWIKCYFWQFIRLSSKHFISTLNSGQQPYRLKSKRWKEDSILLSNSHNERLAESIDESRK